jgi:hypothetical protein
VGAARIGRVEQNDLGLRWRVVFPDSEHEAAASYLHELVASDCSAATARSYAFALLRWLRFLLDRHVSGRGTCHHRSYRPANRHRSTISGLHTVTEAGTGSYRRDDLGCGISAGSGVCRGCSERLLADQFRGPLSGLQPCIE